MKALEKIVLILAALGAINWGLAELGWNAVEALIGSWSEITASIVYYIIGLSGIWALVKAFKK